MHAGRLRQLAGRKGWKACKPNNIVAAAAAEPAIAKGIISALSVDSGSLIVSKLYHMYLQLHVTSSPDDSSHHCASQHPQPPPFTDKQASMLHTNKHIS
jgi:hypothetical protein